MTQLKTYFNWSTGKDSALAYHHISQDERFEVQRLVTSINGHHNRVSMHGLRRELMEAQVRALNIPLTTIELPEQPTMEEYNQQLSKTVSGLVEDGFTDCVFGDIFLEDLKEYRVNQLEPLGITAHFPLWKRDTTELLHEFLDLGFKSILICVNGNLLDKEFAGRVIDKDFIKDLPKNVDPCGENGEFHTFCYDGPIFEKPIQFEKGEVIHRSYKSPKEDSEDMGFWFCDLIPS